MAKQEYRLKTLMDIRERKKDDAERFLGECMAILRTEQERLRDMEKELERMVAKREAKKREYAEKAMRGEMDARSAVSSNLYIERLKEQEEMQENAIDGQKSVVAQKSDDVNAARQDLVLANQELKALEKHKEKWQAEVKKAREIKEADMQDEIAQTIYMGRRNDN